MTKQYLSRILLTITLSLGLHTAAAAMSYDSSEVVLPQQDACVAYSFMTPGTSSMNLPGISTATSTGSKVNASSVLNQVPDIFNGSGKSHKHKSSHHSGAKHAKKASPGHHHDVKAPGHGGGHKDHPGFHAGHKGHPGYGNNHKNHKFGQNRSDNKQNNVPVVTNNQPVWKPGQSTTTTVTIPANTPNRGNGTGIYNGPTNEKKPDWKNRPNGNNHDWKNRPNGNNHDWKNRPGDVRNQGQRTPQGQGNNYGKAERVHGAHWCYGACSLHDQGYHSAPRTQKHWCDGLRHRQ